MKIRSVVGSTVLVAAVATLGAGSGCATIVNGRTQKVTVQTEPSGATASVAGVGSFTTPAVIPLDRDTDHVITFTKAGFHDRSVTLKRRLSGWAFGNIIFGGIIGIVIDAATGDWWYFDPETFIMNMTSGNLETLGGKAAEQLKKETAPATPDKNENTQAK